MKDLSKHGMLANLKIRQWSGKKQGRKVTRQIEKDHNARDAGRFNKTLISDDELKDIQKIATAARAYFYEATLPWADNGDRLLPSKNIFEFLTEIRKFREQFDEACTKFITMYPDLKNQAKVRLNGLYDESDYPPLSKLAGKFQLKPQTMPIADLDDFRVAIDPLEVEKLKTEIEESINERIYHATQNIWERIRDAVSHMYNKLSDEDGKFHSSLVSNVEDLIDLLPRLNFTNDPNITRIVTQMRNIVVDPDTLRSNYATRMQTADEAKAILDKVSSYFN